MQFVRDGRELFSLSNHFHYHHVKILKIPYSQSLSKSEKVIKQSDWPRAFWAITQE